MTTISTSLRTTFTIITLAAAALSNTAPAEPININFTAPIRGIVAFPETSPLTDIFSIGEEANISLTYDPATPEDPDTTADPQRGDYIDPGIAFTLSFPDTGLSFSITGSPTQTISTTNDLIADGFATDSIETSVQTEDDGTIAGMLDGRIPDQIGLSFSDIEELPTIPDMLDSDSLPAAMFNPDLAGITFAYVLPAFPMVPFESLILLLDFNAPSGETPDDPILPIAVDDDGAYVFIAVPSGTWIDPPTATGFEYQMTSESLFTEILAFPPAFEGPFEVSVGDTPIGTFNADQSVTFADFPTLLGDLLIDGTGVEAFTITGIDPPVDPDDPTAFPIQLAFSTDTADLTMTPIPEPTSSVILSIIALPLLARPRPI